jgi:hypothetical protein
VLSGVRNRPSCVEVEFLGPVAKASRSELEAARALGTASGQVALVLARLIDTAGPGNGSAVAAWSKAHRECMAAAVQAVPQVSADDPLSRIRAQRNAKRLQP